MGTTLTPAQHDDGMDATLKTVLPSIIRTVVPMLIGWIVGGLARVGLHLDPVTQEGLGVFLQGLVAVVVTAAYYSAVRWLEQKYPQLGWLIGWAKSPVVYAKDAAAAAAVLAGNATAVEAMKNTLNDPTVTYAHLSANSDGKLTAGPVVVEKHAVDEALSYAPGFVPAHRQETV